MGLVRPSKSTRRRLALAVCTLLPVPSLVRADTPATWLAPTSGNWTTASNWSTNSNFPNNGTPTGINYQAIVNQPGVAAYTVTLNSNITVDGLTLNSANVTASQTGGTANLGTLDLQTGTYQLVSGTLQNTRIQSEGGTFSAVNLTGTVGTLDGDTLAAPMQITTSNPIFVKTGLTLDGSTISLVSADGGGFGADIYANGSITIGGTGQIVLNGPNDNGGPADYSVIGGYNGFATGTVTIGPNVTISTGTGGGMIGGGPSANQTNNVINQGTISVSTNRDLYMAGAWSNQGTINVTNGFLILQGSYSTAGLGHIVHSGGEIDLAGTMDNTGSTFDPSTSTGSVHLSGGTIVGGTLANSGSATITIDSGGLSGVTLGMDLNVSGHLSTTNGLNLNGHTIVMGGSSTLSTDAAGLTGAGTVIASGSIGGTFGANITVDGYSGFTFTGTNNGTILVKNPNTPVNFSGTNAGSINISNNGLLYLNGEFTPTTLGQINRDPVAPGTIILGGPGGGTLDNTGGTFDLATTGPLQLNNAIINGGVITSSTGAGLTCSGGAVSTLNGVALGANLTVNPDLTMNVNGLTLNGSSVKLQGFTTSDAITTLAFVGTQTLGGTGVIEFDGPGQFAAVKTFSNETLTIGPNISVTTGSGGAGTIGSGGGPQVVFQGTAQPGTGGTITFAFVNNVGAITAPAGTTIAFVNINNNGAVKTTGGTINLGGSFVLSNLGNFVNAGGTVDITGSLDNSGTTLSTDPTQNPWGLTSGGQITNGTIASPLNVSNGTLNGVTLSGATITVQPSGTLNIAANGITLSAATIALLGSASAPATVVKFAGTQTLSGTGTVRFDGSTSANAIQPAASLTLASGISVITGATGGSFIAPSSGSNTLINNGLLSAQTAMQTLGVLTSSFTNNANAQAINGGLLTVAAATWTNAASGVITINASTFTTGGTWTNAGTINVINSSMANIGGNYTAAALASINFTTSDTINLSGTLDNSANTLNFAGIPAAVNLTSVTINGGTLSLNGTPAVNLLAATLSGVTIDANTTLTLPAGSTLTMSGTWTNQGVITAPAPAVGQTSATLNLGGTFTLASLGTLNTANATLNLTGSLTMAPSETLPLNSAIGSWNLKGGTIHGGAISFAGPQLLHIQNGTLDGVHITGGDFNEDGAAASLTLLNGITVDTQTFNITGNSASLKIDGPNQTIDNLTIHAMAATADAQQTLFLGGPTSTSAITVTLGTAGTLRGNLAVKNNPSRSGNTLLNDGMIQADISGQTLAISPSNFTNNAVAQSINGAILTINATQWTNASAGSISGNASIINFGGNWSNSGMVSLTAASTLNLSGTFTSLGLGSISVSPDSAVNITGALDNTAGGNTTNMLHLNATTGSWNLVTGGTVKNGTIFTSPGQQLNILGGTLSASSLAAGSTIGVANSTGNWTGTWTDLGTINASNATLNLGQSFLDRTTIGNTGAINAVSTALKFQGSFTNQGTIVVSGTSTMNGTINNSASFSASGALSGAIHFTNTGTALFGGTQQWSSGSTFSNTAGTATFSTDAGTNMTISATAGSIIFGSTQHLAGLTVGSGATATASISSPRNVIVTNTLSVTGSFNLNNNDLIVHNGTLSTLTTAIATAHGTSNTWWTNPTGITSSTAATSPSTTALGIELNNDGHGGTLLTTFDNQTVTSTDVLIKYTFAGDADLSGTITSADYILIDNGFNSGGTKTGWRNGDFNYDGSINGDDYTLIDNAFNTQGSTSFASTTAGPTEMIATDTAQIALSAAVPEPTSLSILGIISFSLAGRSRRQRLRR